MVKGSFELIQTLATFLANGVGCFLAFDIEESFGNACLLISEYKSRSRPFPTKRLFPTLGEKPCLFCPLQQAWPCLLGQLAWELQAQE